MKILNQHYIYDMHVYIYFERLGNGDETRFYLIHVRTRCAMGSRNLSPPRSHLKLSLSKACFSLLNSLSSGTMLVLSVAISLA